MKNLFTWFIILLSVWMYPARWGANYFFPEVVAQFGSQVPWLMAWGAAMMFLSLVILAFISHE